MEIRPFDLVDFWVCGSIEIRVSGGCLGSSKTTSHGDRWQLIVCLLFGFDRKFTLRFMEVRSLDFVDFLVCWLMGIRVSGGYL